jgi:protein-L-isoaspartate(D-aspartate) O-methyltransferase
MLAGMSTGAADLAARLRGVVDDERVLAAIAAVPRDAFVPASLRERAWDDEPLPIGGGQTISQPRMVAIMCAALRLTGRERVLDVGTGSGWHCALLASLAARVWSIERDRALSAGARRTLAATGVTNVELRCGDGALGWPEHAPYDAVNVACAGDESDLVALEEQLARGGRLVAPVRASADAQELLLVERRGLGRLRRRSLGPVAFVPLVRG